MTGAPELDAEAELVMRSPHLRHATPETIDEVRRILQSHAGIGPPLSIR